MLENIGYAAGALLTVLGIAAIGGAVVIRWRSGGEKEAISSYKNAVDGYKEELLVANSRNDRLEIKVAEQDRVIKSQGDQIQMLSRMVTGVEAIGNLEKKLDRHWEGLDSKFQSVHDHINRVMST